MIALLLEKLPASIEVYGYEFKWKIYYEYQIDSWVIAYIPTAVLKKTAVKKKLFSEGRWGDKDATVSTNGGRWLIASPIVDTKHNLCFENALRDLTHKLEFMIHVNRALPILRGTN